jgi:opacity protein-like surface antigen
MLALAMAGFLASLSLPPEDETLPGAPLGDEREAWLDSGRSFEDLKEPLPRELTLAEQAEPAKQEKGLAWWIGGHLGVAVPFDGGSAFLIGFVARVDILPWLTIEGSADYHRDDHEGGDIQVTEIPIQLSALYRFQVDWPIKPYALAGFGLYYTDVHFSGAFSNLNDRHDFHVGFHLGGGVDYPVSPTIVLDADIRFVFVEGAAQGADFSYFQFTVGIMFRLTK